jgi:hypothetical protein
VEFYLNNTDFNTTYGTIGCDIIVIGVDYMINDSYSSFYKDYTNESDLSLEHGVLFLQ